MTRKIIGLVGCGFIGSKLGEHIEKELSSYIDRIYLWDTVSGKLKELSVKLSNASVAENMEDLIQQSDFIIEAASPAIVPELVQKAIRNQKNMMCMSIGGFLGHEHFLDEARRKNISIILPSGAVAGIDYLKASKIAGIKKVVLTTRKSPKSIQGAPYILEKGIEVDKLEKETVIFRGNALDAIKGFPKNVNVSALLSIAGIGAEKTTVCIVVSPEYVRNIHEITIQSEAGDINIQVKNLPSPDNPKTSYVALLAAIACLNGYFDPIRIGT